MHLYVNIQTYDRRLKIYHRVNHLNPYLYKRLIISNTSHIDSTKASIESLIVKGSYDKVIELLDSSGRPPSKKCKSDDVLPPLSHENNDENSEENDEPLANMESYSPVEGSEMVQSHPPAFIDLNHLVLEEKDICKVLYRYVDLQSCKLSLEIYERLYPLNPKIFGNEIGYIEYIRDRNEKCLKTMIVEGGCDELMEVIGNC